MTMGRIYFLECAGRIKIGFSLDVEGRIRELSTGAPQPLVLIGSIEGTRSLEAQIHRHLVVHRASGEWFVDCHEVREAVASILADPTCQQIRRRGYPELSAALKRISEPLRVGESTRDAITRAATKTQLSYWRAFDVWYGKARRVEISEALKIKNALIEACS